MLTDNADCSQFHHFTGLEVYHAGVENYAFNTLKAVQIYGPGVTFLPHFVRFDQVHIEGLRGQSIEEKCELFVTRLTPLKAALGGSHVNFYGTIDQEHPDCFRDPTHLLSFLRNQFLPLFGTSRRYDFRFRFGKVEETEIAVTNLISHTLELPQIIHCSGVLINAFFNNQLHPPPVQIRLPVDAIANWLNQNPNETSAEKQQERRLQLNLHCRIQNGQELCDHVKKVCFYVYFFEVSVSFIKYTILIYKI